MITSPQNHRTCRGGDAGVDELQAARAENVQQRPPHHKTHTTQPHFPGWVGQSFDSGAINVPQKSLSHLCPSPAAR